MSTPQLSTASQLLTEHLNQELQEEIQKRHEANEALRLAEYRYRSIFEHALEGIFQTTLNGTYINANPALIQMYGYSSFQELANNVNNIATLLYVDSSRREEFIRIMQEKGQVLHFESEIYRKDGQKIWISENVRSIRDGSGQFLYYEGTVQDITESRLVHERELRLLETLERAQLLLETELAEATGYVRSLLPALLNEEIETHWCYLPSSHLGGDGFGYHQLDDEHLAIYLLDVSGHGVGSALMCISILNVLRSQSLAATSFHDPSEVLRGLNHAFPMERNNEKYFTIWYGVYHQPSQRLTYASGGHHASLLFAGPQGTRIALQTRGAAMGIVEGLTYPSAQITLELPSEIYLFSDGVYEIARPDGSWQTFEEFCTYLQQARPNIETLVKRMRQMHGAETFEDDFSLLYIKIKSNRQRGP